MDAYAAVTQRTLSERRRRQVQRSVDELLRKARVREVVRQVDPWRDLPRREPIAVPSESSGAAPEDRPDGKESDE